MSNPYLQIYKCFGESMKLEIGVPVSYPYTLISSLNRRFLLFVDFMIINNKLDGVEKCIVTIWTE